VNDTEYALIKKKVHVLTGIDLEYYKSPQVRRRLDSYLTRTRMNTWPEFLHSLDKDPQAVRQLRDFLTINVTSFYRDLHKWEELSKMILPQIHRPGSMLSAWSAGCSIGAEPYSLSILFREQPGITRYRILGTDIDRGALQHARAGGPFPSDAVKDLAPAIVTRYFRQEGGSYWVQPVVKDKVTFSELDLLRITAKSEFDLVLCRNVLIYFTEDAKSVVLGGLIGALRPGGVLFIGSTESIPQGIAANLQRVGLSFYRRVS
jgi:chemotaxis protein methyltransferase CheR